MLTVLLPAHNEAEGIAEAIESLQAQTLPPDRIVVIADNCSDDTVKIASSYPVTVMETVDNPYKKSGALNQGWAAHGRDADYVFTMDADTILEKNFFELTVKFMDDNPDVGGACACPMLKPIPEGSSFYGSILWRLGRLDFGGYMRILTRWDMAPQVLFGYGTVVRAEALENVAAVRKGAPWNTGSIVEDYRLSLDLKRMAYRLAILPGAFAYTDVPQTIWGPQGLWRQRVRWAGGTWEELRAEGYIKRTKKVWHTVVGCLAATLLRLMGMLLWVAYLAYGLPLAWSWFWAIPIGIALVDRLDMIRYTKNSDWKDMVLIAVFIPMEILAVIREAWTVVSGYKVWRNKSLAW